MKFEEKNGGFWSKNCGFEREREAEKTKRHARDVRETEKF